MSREEFEAWTDAADAHALGEGPAPGVGPDAAARAEEQLFAALPSLAAPVAHEQDAALVEQLLDRAAAGTPSTGPASAIPKWAVAAGVGLVAAMALLGRGPKSEPTFAPAPAVVEGEKRGERAADATSRPAPAVPAPVAEAPAVAPAETPEPPTQTAETSSPAPAAKPKSKPQPSGLSAAELLARARAKRGEGDKRGAEKLYRQLVREHPKSPEAHASRISLGQLQLSLGKAKSALSSFQAYKRKGGPLLEEAHWGIIRAFDRLGRQSDRDRAIDALEARFPSSAYRSQAAKLQGGK
jgi:hypothetical protein